MTISWGKEFQTNVLVVQFSHGNQDDGNEIYMEKHC